MAGSDAEREIRTAVVDRLRDLFPGGRIIHELNVRGTGSNRIDVASVTTDKIIAVEIKSEKDVLKRLDDQVPTFSACSDWLIVAAHRKHFVEHREPSRRAELPSDLRINSDAAAHLHRCGQTGNVWCYPTDEDGRVKGRFKSDGVWPLGSYFYRPDPGPAPADLLFMLWADELRSECARAGIGGGSRATILDMVVAMCRSMTGRDIRHAVCRQLRARPFKEADDPIPLDGAWKVAYHG